MVACDEQSIMEVYINDWQQWRNVVGLANRAPLGDENAPLSGAPGVRAYWEQIVKKWQKNLNKK